MANHGDIRNVRIKLTRAEIEAEVGNLETLETFLITMVEGFGEMVTSGFATAAIIALGGSVAWVTSVAILSRNRDLLESILQRFVENPAWKSVYLDLEYRYTDKDGGLWIPTNKMSLVSFSVIE